jgi:DNA-binding MarR family transcriptional regulator
MAVATKVDDVVVFALNESARDVYMILRFRKLKVNDIERKTKYSPRTIRQAIRKLLDLRLIHQIPDMSDFRSHYYSASEATA